MMFPPESSSALFLDFDGVLFDSLPEAYCLGRTVLYGNDIHEKFDTQSFSAFRSARFLITRSAQYWRIFKILETHGNNLSIEKLRKEYKKLEVAGTPQEMLDFDENFLALRKQLICEKHDFWLSLSTPYPFLGKLRERFNSSCPPVIVTTKNRNAVLENLTREYILCPPENILDKQDCANYKNDKGALIADFMAKNKIERGFFVDDSIENIKNCSRVPGLVCLLAGWGYCDPSVPALSCENILKTINHN